MEHDEIQEETHNFDDNQRSSTNSHESSELNHEAKDCEPDQIIQPENEESQFQELLQKAQEESKENYNKYLRACADIDNMSKRFQKEKADIHKYGNEGILKDFLPILDSMEKAASLLEGSSEQFIEGFNLIQRQISDLMDRHGLVKVESAAGVKFNPNLHQAIQQVPDEGVTEDTIKMEFSKGYLLNGRLIRPAMVSVSIPAN